MPRTIYFESRPKIIATSGVAGPKECAGCLKDYIQTKLTSDVYGEESFEKAESRMLFTAIKNSIANAGISESEIDAIVAGDLLNQIISSTLRQEIFLPGISEYITPARPLPKRSLSEQCSLTESI